ncbi:MAG: SCO family protein [Steroidobacteraceae bacterium]
MNEIKRRFRTPIRMFATFIVAFATVSAAVFAQAPNAAGPAAAADPHAAHRHMMANSEVRRSEADYVVPHLALVRDDGANVLLDDEVNDGRPVVVSFIFTTCTTICPLTSHILSMLQQKLVEQHANVHFISVSIDPEQDTPARLREFASRFGAGPNWQHYTGTLGASIDAQKAFEVYRGDKSTHVPVTLMRTSPDGRWVRFEGFATPEALLEELRVRRTAQNAAR